jgi:hypothetical protein
VQRQQGEQRDLPPSAERELLAVPVDLDRTQDAELDDRQDARPSGGARRR